MSKEKILIVDDEASVRRLIKKSLSRENMTIYESENGEQTLDLVKKISFDLIILDVMMEDIDGLEVLKKIRSNGINIPILIVSGRNEDYDEILGFGIGADDYITKPFSPAVLCARVKAHLRRKNELVDKPKTTIDIGNLSFNLNTLKLYKNDTEIPLSSKETMLMKFFMENPNQVFSKEQLYRNIWGDTIIDDNSIMVYIRHLRIKIEDNPKQPSYIQTVWGIGYKFVDNND